MAESQEEHVSSKGPPLCTSPCQNSLTVVDIVEPLVCVASNVSENLPDEPENLAGYVAGHDHKSNKATQLSDVTDVESEEKELGDEINIKYSYQIMVIYKKTSYQELECSLLSYRWRMTFMYFLAEIEGPEQKSDSETKKDCRCCWILTSLHPEVDFYVIYSFLYTLGWEVAADNSETLHELAMERSKKDWMKTVGKQRDGREGIFMRLSEIYKMTIACFNTNNLRGIDPYSRKVYYLDDPVHLLFTISRTKFLAPLPGIVQVLSKLLVTSVPRSGNNIKFLVLLPGIV
ncbi:uncharacterized protein DS421_10g304830 [Arachis hypogaea]|nr:uncharacterized protein DS421_10g304830 [Arachis hypogaea]